MEADWHRAAVNAADLIDGLQEEYGDSVKVGEVMVVVEIESTDADGDEFTGIHIRCSDRRRWVQDGLLRAAARAVYSDQND